MFVPSRFKVDEDAARQALAGFDRLAIVVVGGPQGLTAAHIPLVYEDGHLRGHIARVNEVASYAPCDALVICPGPEAYISPKWYPTKAKDGRAVPTWNYTVIHASGPMTLMEDEASIRANLEALSERHERGRADPWRVDSASADYVAALMGAIVGIDIEVRKVSGKAKLSQDKPAEDVANVVNELSRSPDARDRAVADLMRDLNP
jgi:transcriptional regulator